MKFFLFLSLILFSSAILADDVVYVTAEKVKRSYDKSTSTINVLNFDDLEFSQESDVVNAIRKVPGVSLSSNGANGKATSLYLRGTDTRHTLILLDDIEIMDTTSISNAPRLEFISLDGIEKIEILKGPQGVLYGSQALGGVIKLSTRKLKDTKESNFKVGYGSYDDRRFSFNTIGNKGIYNYLLSSSWQSVEGISSFNEERTTGADKDGYSNLTTTAKLGIKVGKGEFDLLGRVVKAKSEEDFSTGDDKTAVGNYNQNILAIGYSRELFENLNSKLNYSFSEIDRFRSSNLKYVGNNRKLKWINSLDMGEDSLVFGAEYGKEVAEAFGSDMAPVGQESNSYFANYHPILGNLFADIGVRHDHQSRYSDEQTWKMAAGYEIIPKVTILKSGYNTGYKVPSLYQSQSSFGSKNLRPEKSRSWEAALIQKTPIADMELVYFKTDYKDYIDYDTVTSMYANKDKVKISGVEASAKGIIWENIQYGMNATFLETFDNNVQGYLARRPKRQYNFDLTYIMDRKKRVGMDWMYKGERNDSGRMPSYYLLNAHFEYDKDDILYAMKFGNLLNKRYEDVRNFGTEGRTFLASVKLNL